MLEILAVFLAYIQSNYVDEGTGKWINVETGEEESMFTIVTKYLKSHKDHIETNGHAID